MGDVEEMIGELEADEDEEDEEQGEPSSDEDEEGAFGLDLDGAWSSPDREE